MQYVGVRFEEPRKITRNLGQDNWFQCQNVNQESPDIMIHVTVHGTTINTKTTLVTSHYRQRTYNRTMWRDRATIVVTETQQCVPSVLMLTCM
jgi:tRNA U54 and U55 pseudouridine synthase Pus10